MIRALLPSGEGRVTGDVEVPGSKSETNRALVIAALADGPGSVTGALASRDSDLMVAALQALGVRIHQSAPGVLQVTPPSRFRPVPEGIDCGLAGTVMRFVPPLALLADGPTRFHGDPHASRRPMQGLLDGLRQLGASVDSDSLPLTVVPGAATTHEVVIDSSASSQFISGLVLVGARLPHGLRITHRGESVPSRPHIAMTTRMLHQRGVRVDEVDQVTWHVHPGPIRAQDVRIEPDLTNAAVFLSAAIVLGGSVHVPGWPEDSLQPGNLFLDVARSMGADIHQDQQGVTLGSDGTIQAVDLDLHAASELTPVVAALAGMAQGTSTIRGVGHIRGHETNRLEALTAELNRLGIRATETGDGLEITGNPQGADAHEVFQTYADHRMVHAAALLALRHPGLHVSDLECVSKTMPDFPERWGRLVGR